MVSNIIGNKIAMLRKERGLNQGELAEQLSIFMGRSKAYQLPTVSAWETGRKIPPIGTLQNIADFFGVDIKELIGNDKLEYNTDDGYEPTTINSNEINPDKIGQYHNLPLFCVFINKKQKDEWGLCDCKNGVIIFTDREPLSITEVQEQRDSIKLYTIQPYGSIEKERRIEKPLTIQKIKKAPRVWVEMFTFDDFVRGRYNGWFYNNKSGTCLINANGDILPYEGVGYSYNAYLEDINRNSNT